ncbi:MAG: hypothetical protein AAFY08_08765 [Planctomycetota bacterium]
MTYASPSSLRLTLFLGVAALAAAGLAPTTTGLEIDGVQPAALDQPRVTMTLRQTADGEPIVGEATGGLAGAQAEMLKDLLDDPALQDLGIGEAIGQLAGGGGAAGAFTAFLDTGASGVMLSGSQAAAMGLSYEKSEDGRRVVFEDVGVAGTEEFAVTTPLFVDLGTFAGGEIGEHMRGPLRLQVKPGGGMLENLTGPINLAGMPLMVRRVMVMDASGMSDLELLKTSLLPPGHPDIPRPDANTVTVPLTYVDFADFTRTIPDSADPPSLAPSPMIGPDPFGVVMSEGPQPLSLHHHGQRIAGTWLLDTGAVASILSEKHANALGVTVRPDGSGLDGPGTDRQFTLPIGGVGGIKNVHGFFIEKLVVPTTGPKKDEHLVYLNAPVLVLDITITHPQTGEAFTLDGVFGMNYLVASAHVSTAGGMLGMPAIGDIRDTPFRHAVIDHAAQRMRLHPAHLD